MSPQRWASCVYIALPPAVIDLPEATFNKIYDRAEKTLLRYCRNKKLKLALYTIRYVDGTKDVVPCFRNDIIYDPHKGPLSPSRFCVQLEIQR